MTFRIVVLLALIALSGDFAFSQEAPVLEEVIVRATKRPEDQQSVPVAVSALTGADLQGRGISETSDLMGSLPNLQVTSAYAQTQPNFSVRGISVANEFSATTASPIGVYVDEVYQTFRASHGQQLFDIQQIEVIRGPQGTLFGKNTTGGAISFATRKPSLQGQQGYLSLSVGNYSTQQLTGAYENNATDSFGYRIAGTVKQGDGYTFNPVDSQYYGEPDAYALRLSALWEPTDNFSGTFKVYTAENDARGDLPYGIGYLEGGRNILALDLATGTLNPLVPGLREGFAENEVASDSGNGYRTSSEGFVASLEYALGEFTLKSITGADMNEYRVSPFDCDGSAVDLCAIRYSSKSESWSQDFRFEYTRPRLNAIGGVFFGDENIKSRNAPDFFGFLDDVLEDAGIPRSFFNAPILSADAIAIVSDGTPSCGAITINPEGFYDSRSFFDAPNCSGIAPPFTSVLADQQFEIDRPTRALYGEVDFDITDRLSLTLGARYTEDKVAYRNALTVLFSADGTAQASTIPYSYPYDSDLPRVNRNERSEEWSGRLILSGKVNDNVLTYASASRGYRAGTYNGLAYQDIQQVYFVGPEIVNAAELGVKSRFADQRVQLNAAVFHYDYKRQQIAEIVGVTAFVRAVNGKVSGGEIELTALPFDTVTLSAALGFLDSKYDDNQVLFGGGAQLDIGGNKFPNAPDRTFSLAADWMAMQSRTGSLHVAVEAEYMGRYYFDPFGDYDGQYVDSPQLAGPPLASRELALGNPEYWVLDGSISYVTDKFTVGAWARNLTDEFYHTYGLNLNAFFQDYLTRGLPRTYGLMATFNF